MAYLVWFSDFFEPTEKTEGLQHCGYDEIPKKTAVWGEIQLKMASM
jgi:hypothetical protein